MLDETVERLLFYLRQLRRRRLAALAVAWLVAVLGWAAVLLWPDSYESRARIFVDPETVLQPLLRGLTVEVDAERRVEAMRRALTSRPNLEEVARRAGLVADGADARALAETVRRLAREIRVEADREVPGLFTVSWRARDPGRAHAVVAALVEVFVENNARTDRADLERARGFIERQIAAQARALDEAERRLAEFRKRHVDLLAGEQGYFFRLEQARARVAGLRAELEAARARRAELARRLAATPRYLPLSALPTYAALPQTGPAAELARLEARLAELRQRYTEAHPDVVATRRAIEALRARLEAEGGGRPSGLPNPLHDQLAAQLAALDAEIASIATRLEQAERDERELLARARTAPEVEAELKRLTRDYEVIRRNYEELVARREAARIADALQAGDEPARLRIVDPPSEPVLPAAPPRTLLLAGVLLGSLAAGTGYALARAALEQPFETARALERTFGLPVVGVLPFVPDRRARRRQRLLALVTGLGLLLLAAGTAGVWLAEKSGTGARLRAAVHDVLAAERAT